MSNTDSAVTGMPPSIPKKLISAVPKPTFPRVGFSCHRRWPTVLRLFSPVSIIRASGTDRSAPQREAAPLPQKNLDITKKLVYHQTSN